MNNWKVWLGVAGLIVALLVALNIQAQRLDAANARADLATERLQTANERNTRQAQTITRLTGEVAAQRLDQLALQQTTTAVRQEHADDQVQKKEQRREDSPHQSWADQPLPVAARRLHQRPAITGADGYRQWLSSRHALHAQPSGTDR
jgi:LysB family phage lysis regulatory protein